MRPLRVLLVLLLIGGGIGASLVLISKEVRSLHGSPLFQLSPSTTTAPPGRPRTRPSAASERRRPRHTSGRRPAPPHPAPRTARHQPGPARRFRAGIPAAAWARWWWPGLRSPRACCCSACCWSCSHCGACGDAAAASTRCMSFTSRPTIRPRARTSRTWSSRSRTSSARGPPTALRDGQPYVALELICGGAAGTAGGDELEWSINMRCEPRAVAALDGAISAAYPDVRLGRAHGEEPRPRPGALREPGYVMRFRKERSFVYSLIADGEEQASSPLEQIARAQIAAGAPSIVRFQLTPTPSYFEELARRLYRRHENKLVRQERWGLPEGGLISTFNRAEMRAAERTQNRSLFWLETVIAADSREVCKTVAAAVQSRRGENRLHRRWMIIRQRLYRRRFARALGPLIPSFRTLVSAAEVAHLLELPSARMKGVPVRRVTIPRIPAPPGVTRGRRARHAGPSGREAPASGRQRPRPRPSPPARSTNGGAP